MTMLRPFAGPTGSTRSRTTLAADLVVAASIAILFWLLLRMTGTISSPFNRNHAPTTVSTDPSNLPLDAALSLLRMFVALAASVLFTFVYATAAARSRRAEKVLLPILDILQSVPVLSFLGITMSIWLTLFPHSTLGVECACIFAVFTSQAWNITFAFYHSLVTQPPELDEAARLLRLTKWQRFWQLDVPSGMIPLVWNGMMSFGGGWFFLTASEIISVNNHTYALPGIGSYVGAATAHEQIGRVFLAIGVMVVMIIAVNVLFWRPITAWAERFRIENSESAEQPRSVTLDLLRRSRIPHLIAIPLRPVARALDKITRPFGIADRPLVVNPVRRRAIDVVYAVAVLALVAWGLVKMLDYISTSCGLGQFPHAFLLGLATFARVLVLVVASSVIWVPIGVWIGMNPKVNRFAQPIVQVCASFPANFLFPFVTLLLIKTGISLNIAGIFLMALGAQWYILFNVIAGASAIPNDLREAADNLQLSRRLRWKTLILPAIFGTWVTGAITAAGGAWNASIVAEVVTYGKTTLTATGLGAYIAQATTVGNFGKELVGVTVMSAFVVGLNRTVWRKLYRLADTRFSLN
ncbi:ABC transporter permease [Flexivirga caeni]|uniref:ABC transporter permease subunit n=1 Tax=Flexivirga caeni TaxID=2294115 RepID=A0A3M9M3E4_9MICO|nr:ABC transporter permease subunit [Flexivirga caeni]RNI19453.1 ABC transporter permease subunit [Flexivirga caeni]